MLTLQSLEAWVFCNFKSQSISNTELLQFSNDTISDIGDTLAEETIHTGFENIQSVLDREVDEVGVWRGGETTGA